MAINKSCRIFESASTLKKSQSKLLDEEIYELENLELLYKDKYTKPILLDPETDDSLLKQHYLRVEKVLLEKGLKLKWKEEANETKVPFEKPVVSHIEYVLNPLLLVRYSRALWDMRTDNLNLAWLFHGTSTNRLNNICLKGFYKPGQVSFESHTRNKGLYGYGCYFSNYAFYARYYSADQNSNQILLCRTICGKIRTVDGCLGANRTPGYDSHVSRCSYETVLFHIDRILPMYIIHLEPINK